MTSLERTLRDVREELDLAMWATQANTEMVDIEEIPERFRVQSSSPPRRRVFDYKNKKIVFYL